MRVGQGSDPQHLTGIDFVSSLTTPYDTTSFRQEPNSNGPRVIEATDPMGDTEHLEWQLPERRARGRRAEEVPDGFGSHNSSLDAYNTLYWGKRAWALHPGDVSQASLTG